MIHCGVVLHGVILVYIELVYTGGGGTDYRLVHDRHRFEVNETSKLIHLYIMDNEVYHTVATLRDCPREDWLATHEDWLATGISTSFWRLQKTEHVRSSVPTSCRLQVAQSLHSVRLAIWPISIRERIKKYH